MMFAYQVKCLKALGEAIILDTNFASALRCLDEFPRAGIIETLARVLISVNGNIC